MHCLIDLTDQNLWRIDSKRQVVAWGFRGKEVKGSLTRVSSEQFVQTEKPNNNNNNNNNYRQPIKIISCSCHCVKSKYRNQK